VSGRFQAEDLEAVIAEGSLVDLFASLAGKPIPKQAAPEEDAPPPYTIPRPGAWPIGTAATGPTPGCPCPDCRPAA
jgi:hypothetical protein